MNKKDRHSSKMSVYFSLYHNQINARALIGQSAMVYYAGKPMEITRVFELLYKSNRPQVFMVGMLEEHSPATTKMASNSNKFHRFLFYVRAFCEKKSYVKYRLVNYCLM